MRLAVLFGGSSNEHDVSIASATSVIMNLDKEKYDITPVYLDRENRFYIWGENIESIQLLKVGDELTHLKKIDDPISFLKTFNCVFMMVHGKNGEDGILASIFDFFAIPYVGNKPVASMITMDKIYTKDILEKNNISTAKYISFTKYHDEYIMEGISFSWPLFLENIKKKIHYPVFVKPANSGSSIGVIKVKQDAFLEQALIEALKIDERVLIEEAILGRELECAILENNGEVLASRVGEVLAGDEFYSFDAKYHNQESKTVIPADISLEDEEKIRKVAIQAFKTLNLHGLSRVDFFLTPDHQVILNEINTIPGFTTISMYPKLWEASGISYSELLDILIVESIKK